MEINLPPARWKICRGRRRRFVAKNQNITIPLRGIRKQIETNHFPYHIAYRMRPFWTKRQTRRSNGSSQLGLKHGQLFDKEVENAIRCNDCNHPMFACLDRCHLHPVDVKLMVTNAEPEKAEASCAEIDLVTFNRSTKCFACVEVKRTTKTMHQLEKEEIRSPKCRKTNRKRHFLDMARMQAQLGAMFLKRTYQLDKVEAYLFVISKNVDTGIVNEYNVLKLNDVEKLDFKWILGYNDENKDQNIEK